MTSVLPAEREAAISAEQSYLFHAGPVDDEARWSDAACLTVDPELFFPVSAADLRSRELAKSVCLPCVVRDACRQRALDDPGLVGIWGGTDEDERRRLRQRGRLLN